MNYGEAFYIWKRNGLKRPEMPIDECIFPNAERLLEMEKINTDLLEACKELLFESEKGRYKDNRPIAMAQGKAQHAIAKAEGK